MAPSYVFAGVGGYYASKLGGLAGVFRWATDGADWATRNGNKIISYAGYQDIGTNPVTIPNHLP